MIAKLKENAISLRNSTLPTPSRIIIDQIIPSIESGRFSAKCVVDTPFPVEAVILCDSLESIKADLLWRHENDLSFTRTPMMSLGDDRYAAVIRPDQTGRYTYTVEASIDRFTAWKNIFLKNLKAGKATPIESAYGGKLMQKYADHPGHAAQDQHRALKLIEQFTELCEGLPFLSEIEVEKIESLLKTPDLHDIMRSVWDDPATTVFTSDLPLTVDPKLAGFSAGYEFLPRRASDHNTRGTLEEMRERLPTIAEMGFDIVYLPLHTCEGDADLTSIDPAMGDFDDFEALMQSAKTLKLRMALDLAFEDGAPHPWISSHPEWFRGLNSELGEAEIDTPALDFESKNWRALWNELKQTLLFWIEKDITIFRISNPHAKSFAFWEWCIREINQEHPDVIFIADAITRPYVMAYLAKIGFNQSYTYFSWLHTKPELMQYMEELTNTELQYYFRPTFWPNSPDILTDTLKGGRALATQRLVLAALLSSNYGVYGSHFDWNSTQPDSLAILIQKINYIRRENPALHCNSSLLFHETDNENLIAWSKQEGSNLVLSVLNLDNYNTQTGMVDLQLGKLDIDQDRFLILTDLLSGDEFQWRGRKNPVTLDPRAAPARVFRVEQT